MTSRFTTWSKQAVTNPTIWTEPEAKTRISVRLMAGFYGQHTVKIEPGDPHASIEINRTRITFPDPLDDSGTPTEVCRTFLVNTVQEAVRRDRHQRSISWPDGSVTAFTRDDLTPIWRPSSARKRDPSTGNGVQK